MFSNLANFGPDLFGSETRPQGTGTHTTPHSGPRVIKASFSSDYKYKFDSGGGSLYDLPVLVLVDFNIKSVKPNIFCTGFNVGR